MAKLRATPKVTMTFNFEIGEEEAVALAELGDYPIADLLKAIQSMVGAGSTFAKIRPGIEILIPSIRQPLHEYLGKLKEARKVFDNSK